VARSNGPLAWVFFCISFTPRSCECETVTPAGSGSPPQKVVTVGEAAIAFGITRDRSLRLSAVPPVYCACREVLLNSTPPGAPLWFSLFVRVFLAPPFPPSLHFRMSMIRGISCRWSIVILLFRKLRTCTFSCAPILQVRASPSFPMAPFYNCFLRKTCDVPLA